MELELKHGATYTGPGHKYHLLACTLANLKMSELVAAAASQNSFFSFHL